MSGPAVAAAVDGLPSGAPATADRLRFLQAPGTYGVGGDPSPPVETVETHMAWIFLAGDRVRKLKKAVRFPYLDFSTLAAREHACREELRLNARLAPGVYLGLDVLQWDGRALSLVPESGARGDARTLDWLVRMRRLPRDRMLDALVARHAVTVADIEALGATLAGFYRRAPRLPPDADGYVGRFVREHATNAATLCDPRFALRDANTALARFERVLAREEHALRERSLQRRLVDGHGDLRPEHVCLVRPPAIIDALEFNAELRRVDPFEEIALLGVECEAAGAPWIGPRLAQDLVGALGDPAGAALLPLHRAYRALLRARLAVAHLLEPEPRRPAHWVPQAQRFVDLALQALDGARDAAPVSVGSRPGPR